MPLGDPIRRPCALCGAHEGERCVDMDTGDLRDSFHRERQLAAIPRSSERARERRLERFGRGPEPCDEDPSTFS